MDSRLLATIIALVRKEVADKLAEQPPTAQEVQTVVERVVQAPREELLAEIQAEIAKIPLPEEVEIEPAEVEWIPWTQPPRVVVLKDGQKFVIKLFIPQPPPQPVIRALTDEQLRASPVSVSIAGGAFADGLVGVKGEDQATIATTANPFPVDVVNAPGMSVVNLLSSANYDLAAAAYSATTTLNSDYLLSVLSIHKTTALATTVTVTLDDGTVVFNSSSDTSLDLVVDFESMGFDGTRAVTVAITQTSGACIADVTLTALTGSAPITGNPTVSQGTSPWVVSGTVTTGGLTDTQLRASAVPVSGPLTDTQLRASAVPVSAASLPLPSGAATSAKQDTIITNLQALNSLVPSTYDYVSLSYTGSDLTGAVFKTGGSGGTTVSTLTLAYSGGNLSTVTRT